MAANALVFKKLSDVTPEKVQKLFMHGQTKKDLKNENPIMVIVIGSPGVGKTTKSKEFIEEHLKISYDTMYHVSLDAIVERIAPYCKLATEAYNVIKRQIGNKEVPYGPLADLYSTVTLSTTNDFGLLSATPILYKKLQNKVKDNTISTKQTPKKIRSKKIVVYTSVTSHFYDALQYGIDQSFNIVYDTTFADNTNKMDKIMKQVEGKHYKIYVLHIVASEDIIKGHLKKRHSAMIRSECLRAINPDLIRKYILQNAIGFNLSHDKYKDQAKFITIVNDAANSSDYYIGSYKYKQYTNQYTVRREATRGNKSSPASPTTTRKRKRKSSGKSFSK